MSEISLRHFFSTLLSLSFVPPAVLLQSCQPAEEAPPGSLPAAEVAACPSASWCDAASRLHPASAVDYLELRTFNLTDAPYPTGCVAAAAGTKCGTATDPTSCRLAVATITPWGIVGRALVATTGDRVQTVDPGSLASFLVPIDSEQEAFLLAMAAYYRIDCTAPMDRVVQAVPGSYQILGVTGSGCGPGQDIYRHTLLVSTDGTISEQSAELLMKTEPNCVIGRRPEGLCQPRALRAQAPLGRHFADMAQLEAASVDAFVVLRAELMSHGAPASLLHLCTRAAADEVSHARVTRRLARRFRGRLVPVQVVARPLRSLPQVALENEIEGCVRETYGALLGCWQAAHAAEPSIRQAMAGIAADELRHAALSWQVRNWAVRRLGRTTRSELQAARRQAIHTLRAELRLAPSPVVAAAAGLPDPTQALELAAQLERELWNVS